MKKEKVLVFSCFHINMAAARPIQIMDYYNSHGYECKLVTTDYCHVTKAYNKEAETNITKLHVIAYKKNMSLKRIISHMQYALAVKKVIDSESPQLVHVCLPPNVAAYMAAKKAKESGIKVIIDIIDIWPQSIGKICFSNGITNVIMSLKAAVFQKWSSYRDKAISLADVIILECDLYRHNIPPEKMSMTHTVHLSKTEDIIYDANEFEGSLIQIIYLGSLGKNYDFDSLITIASGVTKYKVMVLIIGEGEEKENLQHKLECNKIDYKFFGLVFDESKKNSIMKACTLGFNGFHDNLKVGLSYKSIDYLCAGIPLINSLRGDTWALIDKYDCGINYEAHTLDECISKINCLSPSELSNMKKNARRAFEMEFSENRFIEQMNRILKGISNNEK